MVWQGLAGAVPATGFQQQAGRAAVQPQQHQQMQQQLQQMQLQQQQQQQLQQRMASGWGTTAAPTQAPALAAQQARPGMPNATAVSGAPMFQGTRPMVGGKGGISTTPGRESYLVYTKGNDGNEVVVKTLMGEYVEHGSNHGRKVYKKLPEPGGEAVDVFLYYWDGRDGPSFEGWWFGNKLGGTQVWSQCNSNSMTPPGAGWKIPWDGTVRPTLVVIAKSQQANALFENKLRETQQSVTEAEALATSKLEQVRAGVGDYTNAESLLAGEQTLIPVSTALATSLKKFMDSQRGSTGEAAKQFAQLGTQLRAAQNALQGEIAKIRSAKAKVELEQKQKAAEERDLANFNEFLPEAQGKTNSAEDCVEKAMITSEMIAAAGDDMDEVRQAVTQTEQAAQEAQKAIGEARIYLNAKQASTRRYESVAAREKVGAELAKLQQQLQDSQNKLNPLKTVRSDFVQRTAAQRLVQEVLEKLSPAEVDVDRAEEATVLLNAEGLNKEAMGQAEAAVNKATEHVAGVLRFIEQKKKTATGKARDELAPMEERAKSAQNRCHQLRNSHKEAAERITCDALLQEAADKLQAVAESVARAADAEGPFLMGVEELPLQDTLAAVKACETAATSANTAVSIARMFIATKLVEAKRFSEGPSKGAQAKLKEFQADLGRQTEKLNELKKSTSTRKKSITMREAEHEVQKAEDLVRKVGQAAAVFEDDSKLFQLSAKEIRQASDETIKAEQEANAALAEARKFITARQIESKGKDVSAEVGSELIKYQTRLTTAQADVSKYKRLSSTVEQRLASKKVVEEAQNKLKAAEAKVAKVGEVVESLQTAGGEGETGGEKKKGQDDEKKNPSKASKEAEQAAAEAQVSLKTLSRYLETQGRAHGGVSEELAKLEPSIQQAHEKLESTMLALREWSERVVVDGIVKESEVKVKEAEDGVKNVVDLEAPFLSEKQDELPPEDASKVLADLESAVTAAHAAVGGAKTFLAMKRLAAKRLAESSMKTTVEHLNELQARLDASAKKLGETKKSIAEKKSATVKRDVLQKVSIVESKVAAAAEATAALTDVKVEMEAEDMKGACERAGGAQQEAQKVLTDTRNVMLDWQRDAKNMTVDSSTLGEIKSMLDKLGKIQSDLDKQKTALRDQEHKFVAQRLLKDAGEMVEALEKELARTEEVAAALTSESREELKSTIFLEHAFDVIKVHMKRESKTPQDIFGQFAEGGAASETTFVSFCKTIPELGENMDSMLSDEQLKAVFSRMDGKGGGSVTEADFLDQFRSRYIVAATVSMTESMAVKGGKTIRKLEINEVMEGLEEPAKDGAVGLMRLKCKALKDEKEGYVTLSGNQGTVYLQPYSPYTACIQKIERAIQETGEAVKDTAKYVEQKSEELKAVRSGPLAETKAEIMRMRPRVSKVQYAHTQLKKKVAESDKKVRKTMENEKKLRQEAAEKKVAASIVEEAEGLVTACASEVDKAVAAAEALAQPQEAKEENLYDAMCKSEKDLGTLLESIEKTQAQLTEKIDSMKPPLKGAMSEAKSGIVKLTAKVGTLDSKCKKQITAIQAARQRVVSDANTQIAGVMREHVLGKNINIDELYTQLSEGKKEVSVKALRDFVEKIPDQKIPPSVLDVGLGRYSVGLTKLTFLELVEDYLHCVKDIAVTTTFEVKDSKTVRKLQAGEVVQVLEAERVDDSTGLHRVKCRALSDMKEGWVTLRGNQGTAFLDRCRKPYLHCEEETPINKAFESVSKELRTMQPGEVLEVLEGPRQEPALQSQRVRGKAMKDGKQGWVTLTDSCGNINLEQAPVLLCKQGVAITTTFDIGEGKSLRKLTVGEALQILEGPTKDEKRNFTRIKARSRVDGVEGWVTMQGNQGTSYVEETDSHYVCTQEAALQKAFGTDSAVHRKLQVGEVFEVADGPKAETRDGFFRVKGPEGWVTLKSTNFKEWTAQYRCSEGTLLAETMELKGSKTMRQLEVGECLESLETPVCEQASGAVRMRVRAEKDGAVGFATVRDGQGTVLLAPVMEDEEHAA